MLIGVGVGLEIKGQDLRPLIDGQEFLYGAYLIIAAGCSIAVVSAIGMVGAFCETKLNKLLLGFVSERRFGDYHNSQLPFLLRCVIYVWSV